MNKKNNKRKKESIKKIEKVFVELLQTKDITEITVTDICNKASLNRTTFYANYLDIYDLADKLKQKLENNLFSLYQEEHEKRYNSNNFLKLFKHIQENQLLYKTYFKLGFDQNFIIERYDYTQALEYYNGKHLDYHIEFFKAGITSVIKKWLNNGCQETPEEIEAIIIEEYKK